MSRRCEGQDSSCGEAAAGRVFSCRTRENLLSQLQRNNKHKLLNFGIAFVFRSFIRYIGIIGVFSIFFFFNEIDQC